MPRPRFEKLAAAKQERILEAAAREFAAQGFDGASMNQILDQAGISKGAAYYYFDDKADLFITAVSYYSQMMLGDITLDLEAITAETFWPALAAAYQQQFLQGLQRPWVFGLLKAASSQSPQITSDERLAALSQEMQEMLRGLLAHGRSLGVIRDDLAPDFTYDLVMALDDAHDRWLVSQWPDMDASAVAAAVARIIDLLQRILAP